MDNQILGGNPHYVYAASTEHFGINGIYKIGHASDIPSRLKKLSATTSAPEAFFCVAAIRCCSINDARKIENWIHQELGDLGLRVSDKREFFKLSSPFAVFDCFAEAIQKCEVMAAMHGQSFEEFTEAYERVPFLDQFGIAAFGEMSGVAYQRGVIDGMKLCTYADSDSAVKSGINAAVLAAKGHMYGAGIRPEDGMFDFLTDLAQKLSEPAKSILHEALMEMSDDAVGNYVGDSKSNWRERLDKD